MFSNPVFGFGADALCCFGAVSSGFLGCSFAVFIFPISLDMVAEQCVFGSLLLYLLGFLVAIFAV